MRQSTRGGKSVSTSHGKSPSDPSTPPPLRRSKRKLASRKEDSTVFDSPPPTTKKAKKAKKGKDCTKTEISAPTTLMSLNYDVQDKLLQYLDVQSLEALSQTCFHFDLMINGRYLTTVNLPFDEEILDEIKESRIIEKKPVLRLQSKSLLVSQENSDCLFVDSSSAVKQYLIESQLSLLSLSKVREVDLVPEHIQDEVNYRSSAMWDCGQQFDLAILSQLASQGCLANISRLDILLNREDFSRNLWKDFMPAMVNLVQLNITVLERKAGSLQNEEYIYGYLEEIVSITRASRLNLTILSQNKRIKKIGKVLSSDHIQHLHISAPCTFSLVLVMKNLTEVTMEMSRAEGSGKECCSYQGSKMSDRGIHRAGLCIIHLGTLYGRCPRLENFNGINIGRYPMFPPPLRSTTGNLFSKWNGKVKQLFHEDYLWNGGRLEEIKSWSSKRWFTKQPTITTQFGRARLPAYLR